ncbi:HepT-like ribonuclease domain-containing protein [Dehalobacterium formicoaceticum]|uniref:HepT-like ribonuclease domain-containing protein n=1 Tax=Dehalobacterium formicoaceticum TaxID=51515 RepID=UPI000B7E9C45|nr:HepT-like ribonuclease domain-containing protein [Dehalobacterium formicoaceticum]
MKEKAILEKLKDYASQAIQFKDDMTFEEFSNDLKTISACVFSLSQIGELVSRLDVEFVEANNQIPWRKIKGMRNRIVHDYEGIQLNIVWDVLVDFLPELIKSINKIL